MVISTALTTAFRPAPWFSRVGCAGALCATPSPSSLRRLGLSAGVSGEQGHGYLSAASELMARQRKNGTLCRVTYPCRQAGTSVLKTSVQRPESTGLSRALAAAAARKPRAGTYQNTGHAPSTTKGEERNRPEQTSGLGRQGPKDRRPRGTARPLSAAPPTEVFSVFFKVRIERS